ncbi:ABC transporter substrate-binding protein [Candidatus Seribacter sulfatis]|jgi:ABC-type glycerol-3-phosphate transport system substrate-binding protein|uniref:ABC transporter substrate-binding protein n=1 Tax=Candidatus Seribacter sulfatis TaxID=3381756 RepID=UPI003899C93A
MKSKKSYFYLFVIAVLSVLSPLSAKELVIWISSFQDQVYYEQMGELYSKATQNDVKINVKAYGFREMPDKLGVAIRSGQGIPDMVQLDETFFGVFLNEDSPFVDLTKKVKKSGLSKDLHPRRLEVFTYKGKVMGVPQSLSAMVLYYRKDLFEEFDIKPSDLKTWDDVAEVGAQLQEDQGQRFMALDGTLFDVFLRQKGTDLFDKKGNFLPDEEKALEVLEEFAEMSAAQITVMPDRGSIFDPVFFSGDLETGEVLCVPGADWYGLDLFQQFAPGMKGLWGMMPLPTWRNEKGELGPRTATFAGQGLMICKGSKKREESWDFIEFVMKNKEANAERFLQGNSFPAYQPSWKDERLLAKHEYFEQSIGELLIQLAKEIPPVVVDPRRPQAIFLMQENYFGSVMFGALSPKDAIKQYRDAMKNSGRDR